MTFENVPSENESAATIASTTAIPPTSSTVTTASLKTTATTEVDPAFEIYLRDKPGLTYVDDGDSWLRRQVTQSVEVLLGRRRLERHYFALKARNLEPLAFFREAQKISGIALAGTVLADTLLKSSIPSLQHIKQDGPLLFLANHPFGILDGLILCNLVAELAGDFRVVINSLLCQDRDLAPYFLPIDFAGTREAERRNIRTKQLAGEALNDGIPLILFPSGTVSTATHRGFGPVKDTHWTTFAAKLVLRYQPTIVPVFFHGQNSRAFHIASHIAEPLRMAMLMHEALRRFNTTIHVDVGNPLAPSSYQHFSDRQELTQFLYEQVQSTGVNG
jgi:putative hemolysin